MGLYLRQLLAGRDFAKADVFASQMANFVYLIGDDVERTCMVVDPAWDIEGILDFIGGQGMRLVGALVTHYHQDHVGGNIFGHDIAGLAQLQALRPVKIYVNEKESEGVKSVTGVSDVDLEKMRGGDEISIGKTPLRFLHTPGHTPGSQCFLAGTTLISGDTLFIGSCGRVDLPGGDPSQMYYSLTQVLAKLPDETLLYPGHNYSSKPVSTMGEEKRDNYCLKMPSLESWNLLRVR
ncbi:MAG TPA: MBL fold metallo-hydrolase [Blastocatellia bacterium]|jgi:glyoxylase-like metal-dependent hydrolase (beta-lactamase superfamily II)|nr:MBL fold metallo-hydrolase [Blastocatellia bacterium]